MAGSPGVDLPHNLLEAQLAEGLTPGALALLWIAPVLLLRHGAARGEELTLVTWTDEDGAERLPVFTSEAKLAEARPDGAEYFGLRLADLGDGWPEGVELAVNPSVEPAYRVSRAEVEEAAASDAGRELIAAASRILVGEPAQEPTPALEALERILPTLTEVRAAHRAQFVAPLESLAPQLAIGLELAPEADEPEVFGRVLALSQEHVAFDRPVAFLPVAEQADNPVAAYMREQGRPFYRGPDTT